MATKTVTIRGKKYPEPSLDRVKRKQAKKFQEISKQLELDPAGMDIGLLWDMVEILVPALPGDVLDDLDLGECKALLEEGGVMQFSDGSDTVGAPTEAVGESSAS